jgi:hypothetical protein
MTQIKVRTTDQQWIAKHAQRVEDEAAVINVADSAIERLTFAGCAMVRFDLRTVGKRIPRDWPNPWAMLPTTYVVG